MVVLAAHDVPVLRVLVGCLPEGVAACPQVEQDDTAGEEVRVIRFVGELEELGRHKCPVARYSRIHRLRIAG